MAERDSSIRLNLPQQFIDMSIKAVEIQELWEPKDGDFYFDRNGLRPVNVWTDWGCCQRHERYWLIRPDQVAGILAKTHTFEAVIQGLHEFYDPEHFCLNDDACGKCRALGQKRRTVFRSMQELSLAFVMSEGFHKEWDPEKNEWVAV